jgi:hypothetical protein
MVQPANSSVSLAWSDPPGNRRGRLHAPTGYNEARVVPKAVIGPRKLTAANALPRPVMAAEVAQARVFEDLLQAEAAELHELAHRVARGGDKQSDLDSSASAWDLLQLRARIDEVQKLLQALRGRFPQQLTNSDL